MQEITSKNTSINSSKVPKLFKLVGYWMRETKNLDYGGGRYNTATQYLLNGWGVKNYIYDPYNQTKEHNKYVMRNYKYDTATMSNVLNVIKDEEERKRIVKDCLKHLKKGGTLYINVYEGDKSGIGRATKKDCWQENRKLKSYISEISDAIKSIGSGKYLLTANKDMITVHKRKEYTIKED